MTKKTIVGLVAAGVLAAPLAAYATTSGEFKGEGSAQANISSQGQLPSPPSSGDNHLNQITGQLKNGQAQLESALKQIQSGLQGSGSNPVNQVTDQLKKGQSQLEGTLKQLQPPSGSNPLQGTADQLQKGLQQGKQELEKNVNDLQQKLKEGTGGQLPALPAVPGASAGSGDASAKGDGSLQLNVPGVGSISLGFNGQGSSAGSSSSGAVDIKPAGN